MKTSTAIATFALAAVAAISQAQTPLHVQLGNALVDGINEQAVYGITTDSNGKLTNRYGGSYGSTYITFANQQYDDGSVYSSYTKCASFVTLLMKAAYGWTPSSALGNSPDAKEYYTSIRDSAYGFTKRSKFSDWQSGDLLASGYYDNSPDTGHVMVVLRAAELSNDPLTNTKEYNVLVMDSSSGMHSKDSRLFFSPIFNQGGVGRGWVKVKTVNDQPTQWAWSGGASYYSQTDRPVVLGTLN